MQTNYLMHYGVLGMKWGKRKAITTNEKIANKKKKLEDAEEAYAYSSKKDPNRSKIKQDYKTAKKLYKKELKKTNQDYIDLQSNLDRTLLGKKGSKKVNQYLNEGASLKTARTQAYVEKGVSTVKKFLLLKAARSAIATAVESVEYGRESYKQQHP